jgi:hypothetical protein
MKLKFIYPYIGLWELGEEAGTNITNSMIVFILVMS